jgi:hypothetical protein
MDLWIKFLVTFLTAVVGWLLAALQYRPGWKDGRTTKVKRGRKCLFVVLLFLLFASLLNTYYDHRNNQLSSQRDQEFKGIVEDFVQKEKESDVPELVVLGYGPIKSDYHLKVKNVGKRPATKVKLIFTDDSIPSAFSGNLISGTSEIPHGTEYTLPMNLFSGINRKMKLPNSEEGYKEALEESLKGFNDGTKTFIARFYLEYYHGDIKMTSPQYSVSLNKNGLGYFSKEE